MKTTPQSGLYLNDGSTVLSWPIEYRSETTAVDLSSDGKYLVILSPDNYDEVAFYDKGNRLALYEGASLDPHFFPKLFTHELLGGKGYTFGLHRKRFDKKKLTYQVTTGLNEQFTLDVTTGQVIEHWSLWPLYMGIPLIVFPLAIICYSRLRKPKARSRRSWFQFSLLNLLVASTVASVILGLTQNHMAPLVLSLAPSLIGGTIVWLWEKTGEAWLIGISMTLYGGFIGFLAWALLCGTDNDYFYGPSGVALPLLIGCFVMGTLTGLTASFWLLKKYQVAPMPLA